MYITILLILLFTPIFVIFFFPVRVGIEGIPHNFFIYFLFFQARINTKLELELFFLKFKNPLIKIKIFDAFYKPTNKDKIKDKDKKVTFEHKKASTKKHTKTQSSFKNLNKKHLKNFLILLKKFIFIIRLKKIYIRFNWEQSAYLGALYPFKLLLPKSYQNTIEFSFYLPPKYLICFQFRLVSVLWQIIFWYIKNYSKIK